MMNRTIKKNFHYTYSVCTIRILLDSVNDWFYLLLEDAQFPRRLHELAKTEYYTLTEDSSGHVDSSRKPLGSSRRWSCLRRGCFFPSASSHLVVLSELLVLGLLYHPVLATDAMVDGSSFGSFLTMNRPTLSTTQFSPSSVFLDGRILSSVDLKAFQRFML